MLYLMKTILKFVLCFNHQVVDWTRYNSNYLAIFIKSWVFFYSIYIIYRYTTSTVVLQEEAGMVQNEHSANYSIINNLKTKVFEGDWEAVETLLKENCNKE